jgi:hypothetical protein
MLRFEKPTPYVFALITCAIAALGFPGTQLHAQTQRTGSAASANSSRLLTIGIPAKVLSGARWWVYIDQDIVASSAGSNIPTAAKWTDSRLTSVPTEEGIELWDQKGIVLSTKDGIATYIRPGTYNDIFSTATVRLSGGQHDIEFFVSQSPESEPYDPDECFYIAGFYMEGTPGEQQSINFGYPSFPAAAAVPIGPSLAMTPGQLLEYGVSRLAQLSSEFASDARVVALFSAYNDLKSSDTSSHKLFINMPENCGGSRYYDAAQINYITGLLYKKYNFEIPSYNDLVSTSGQRSSITPSQNDAYRQLQAAGAKHNLTIQKLRSIGASLNGPSEIQ